MQFQCEQRWEGMKINDYFYGLLIISVDIFKTSMVLA